MKRTKRGMTSAANTLRKPRRKSRRKSRRKLISDRRSVTILPEKRRKVARRSPRQEPAARGANPTWNELLRLWG